MKQSAKEKRQNYQINIRRKQRQQIRNQIRSFNQDVDALEKQLTIIIEDPDNACLNQVLQEISYVLSQFDIEKIPLDLIEKFGTFFSELEEICWIGEGGHLSIVHKNLINILCKLSTHYLLPVYFTSPYLRLLADQLNDYIIPTQYFYKSMISLGNLLSGEQTAHRAYQALDRISINSMLSDLMKLKIRERQQILNSGKTLDELIYDENEETFAWFFKKYLKHCLVNDIIINKKILKDTIEYLSYEFSIHKIFYNHKFGTEDRPQSPRFSHVTDILTLASPMLQKQFIENTLEPLIGENLFRPESAKLWKHIIIQHQHYPQNCDELVAQIIELIDGQRQNVQHLKRNKAYMKGILFLLLNNQQMEAKEIWRKWCPQPFFDRLMQREDIAKEMDQIEKYAGYDDQW